MFNDEYILLPIVLAASSFLCLLFPQQIYNFEWCFFWNTMCKPNINKGRLSILRSVVLKNWTIKSIEWVHFGEHERLNYIT